MTYKKSDEDKERRQMGDNFLMIEPLKSQNGRIEMVKLLKNMLECLHSVDAIKQFVL